MLTAYIKVALQKAHYEVLQGGEGYFGTIEGLQGVWAQAGTLEAVARNCKKSWKSGLFWGLKWAIRFPPSTA